MDWKLNLAFDARRLETWIYHMACPIFALLRGWMAGILVLAFLMDFARADAPLPGSIKTKLQPYVDRHILAGAVVLIATKDKILDFDAVGFADLESHRLMRKDDFFWIASMTKPMTAVAMMMLVDKGKVGLDDPIEKYLPDFKNMQVSTTPPGGPPVLVPAQHSITIRNILSHLAGFRATSAFEKPTLDAHTLAERVASYAKEPLLTQPGSGMHYANEGPNTAGRIIEVVTGMPYEQYMQEKLFTPLGMTDTTFRPTKEQLSRLVTSYRPAPDQTGLIPTTIDQLAYPLDRADRYPMPAGGLFSSAKDVLSFCRMYLNHGVWNGHRYLSENAWQAMHTHQSPNPTDSCGLGWMVDNDHKVYHGGAYSTNMHVDLKRGVIYIFLVQQTGGWPQGWQGFDGLIEQTAQEMAVPRS
jgi:CubicO group peptidase (beta-lactamase class C family)